MTGLVLGILGVWILCGHCQLCVRGQAGWEGTADVQPKVQCSKARSGDRSTAG